MPVRLAADPPHRFRIGRHPDPLDRPPIEFTGFGRYDDLQTKVSTMYAAVERRTAFLETLDRFRPSPILLTQLDEETYDDTPESRIDREFRISAIGTIAPNYFRKLLVRFTVMRGQRWLDVRAPETQEHLRRVLAREIAALGFGSRFVLGDLLANEHSLTQLIARWAIDNAFDGVAYSSCHDPSLICWAIFEGARLARLNEPEPISKTDPDLLAVARLWDLRIPD